VGGVRFDGGLSRAEGSRAEGGGGGVFGVHVWWSDGVRDWLAG